MLLAEHDWNDDDDGQVRAVLDRTEVHPRRGERGGQERDYDFALLRLKVGEHKKIRSDSIHFYWLFDGGASFPFFCQNVNVHFLLCWEAIFPKVHECI